MRKRGCVPAPMQTPAGVPGVVQSCWAHRKEEAEISLVEGVGYFAAKRWATASQSTTFHQLDTYSERRF